MDGSLQLQSRSMNGSNILKDSVIIHFLEQKNHTFVILVYENLSHWVT